ncbi:MAG TPA: response regulator [Tepidisphaeraceae bacterium]|nr:response regulator [Tepidisphaeraceae bacterium]
MTAHPIDSTKSPSPDFQEEPPLSPRSVARNVLIVEDDRRLRDMLQTSIREMGLAPSASASGEMALRMAAQHSFAVALVDLNLPGMGGMELCQRLRQEKPNVQLIILTGFGDLEAARQAIRLEVVDFLTKPCGMDDLERALGMASQRWLDRWLVSSPLYEPPQPPASAVHRSEGHERLTGAVDEMEREMIIATLARHDGNRQAAAHELGISIRKLYYRLQQYQRQGFRFSDE